MTRRVLEVETLAVFDRRIGRVTRLRGWFVQGLDLTGRGERLRAVDPAGAVFLGCHFDPGTEDALRRGGALIFPRLPDLPFEPYRGTAYDADQLYGTGRYAHSPDARIYAWSRESQSRLLTDDLACALHDHAITDALDDATAGLDPGLVVGVMGGHALARTDPGYRAAADLGGRLARAGRTVLTGGGPGAMEAANLGAYLSPWPDAEAPALELLAATPSYRDGVDAWIDTARAVRQRWPVGQAGSSLSIPTWFYGHEPTNLFATTIAKYFANALREDTLLHRCRGGIVYLPGQAGTVQEIFQAVTENFYAADPASVAPMVLVGRDYWTRTYPAWPLLQQLGEGRRLGEVIALSTTSPTPPTGCSAPDAEARPDRGRCSCLGLSLPVAGRIGVVAYAPPPADRVDAQVRYLSAALDHGAADRMQQLFPEGAFFTVALTAMAAARTPGADTGRARQLSERLETPELLATFGSGMVPEHGIFAAGWSLATAADLAEGGGDPADRVTLARRAEVVDRALRRSSDRFPRGLSRPVLALRHRRRRLGAGPGGRAARPARLAGHRSRLARTRGHGVRPGPAAAPPPRRRRRAGRSTGRGAARSRSSRRSGRRVTIGARRPPRRRELVAVPVGLRGPRGGPGRRTRVSARIAGRRRRRLGPAGPRGQRERQRGRPGRGPRRRRRLARLGPGPRGRAARRAAAVGRPARVRLRPAPGRGRVPGLGADPGPVAGAGRPTPRAASRCGRCSSVVALLPALAIAGPGGGVVAGEQRGSSGVARVSTASSMLSCCSSSRSTRRSRTATSCSASSPRMSTAATR